MLFSANFLDVESIIFLPNLIAFFITILLVFNDFSLLFDSYAIILPKRKRDFQFYTIWNDSILFQTISMNACWLFHWIIPKIHLSSNKRWYLTSFIVIFLILCFAWHTKTQDSRNNWVSTRQTFWIRLIV